jgi:hypothetical protein
MKHRKSPQDDFTAADWKALMFVYLLFQEVALYGKSALDTFLEAMREVPDGPTR